MQTPNFYLITGVAGNWQFWAEADEPEACWLIPAGDGAQELALLAQRHPQVRIEAGCALVPQALLQPAVVSQQPSLF